MKVESGNESGHGTRGVDALPLRSLGWILVAGIAAASCASGRSTNAPADRGESIHASKLSPGFATLASGVDERPVAVLIRTQGPVAEDERRALRAAGVELHAVVGDVVSARVARRDLERVAALPFVRYVEPGRALRPEQEPRP